MGTKLSQPFALSRHSETAVKEQVQTVQLSNDVLFQPWGNCVLTASWTESFLGSYLDPQVYESISNLSKYLFNKYLLAQASWSDAHVCNQRDIP